MFFMNTAQGICLTCQHRSDCQHLQENARLGSPIWECEEFEVTETLSEPSGVEKAGESVLPTEFKSIQGRDLGLCVNCDRRQTCGLPVAAGGVWHCEEYE